MVIHDGFFIDRAGRRNRRAVADQCSGAPACSRLKPCHWLPVENETRFKNHPLGLESCDEVSRSVLSSDGPVRLPFLRDTSISIWLLSKREADEPEQVAPIGNRLYRRLAAGLTSPSSSQRTCAGGPRTARSGPRTAPAPTGGSGSGAFADQSSTTSQPPDHPTNGDPSPISSRRGPG